MLFLSGHVVTKDVVHGRTTQSTQSKQQQPEVSKATVSQLATEAVLNVRNVLFGFVRVQGA